MFVAKYSWHILLFLQMSVAERSPMYLSYIGFSVLHYRHPILHIALRLFPFLWFVSYIYNKVEWQQRLIT